MRLPPHDLPEKYGSLAMPHYTMKLVLLFVLMALIPGPLHGKDPKPWWRTYEGVEFDDESYYDGDSFTLKVPSGKTNYRWKIRIYGSDAPETEKDKRSPQRLAEQAKTFGLLKERDVIKWGKKARRATGTWLREAKEIHLHVREAGKEKGYNGRFLGIVEIIPKKGDPFLLHERLLKEGLASPTSHRAPWPEKDLKRWREAKLKIRFRKDLENLKSAAKRKKQGVWSE
jgi:endonuclease YncB( thermonuclease family)